LPFNASSEFEIMLAHVNEVPEPPSSINHEIPEELDELIMKALAKHPSQRFQTAAEFSNALAEGEAPDVSSPAPVSAAAAVRTDRAENLRLSSAAAAQKKSGAPRMDQWFFREWTFAELALGGLITSIILTLVFVALMTLTGALPLSASH